MAKTHPRLKARLRRKVRIRKRVRGTADIPRLSVFRSARHIYAQLIDDERGVTLVAAGSVQQDGEGAGSGNKEQAAAVGTSLALKASGMGIKRVRFDRNGFLYHGRVKALADAARAAGLEF